MAGAIDEDLDVRLGESGDPRRFFRREFLAETQPQYLKLTRRQDAAGPCPEVFAQIFFLGAMGGRRSGAGGLLRNRLPFSRGAEMIQGIVARDGEQPVDQRPAAVETVATLVAAGRVTRVMVSIDQFMEKTR